jgi:DNA-binding beta-propeller fold protein YncE
MAVTAASRAFAAIPRGDLSRYVFVLGRDSSGVTVFDSASNAVAANLDIGLVPKQVEISRELSRLVATDGRSQRIVVFDVPTETATTIDLPILAERVTLGTSGWLLAVIDTSGGRVAVVDLIKHRVVTVIDGLAGLSDAMFGGQDALLYVATGASQRISIIDIATGQKTGEINTESDAGNGIRSFARLPDGRRILALPEAGGRISIVDPEGGGLIGVVDGGQTPSSIISSGTGKYLLIPDPTRSTIGIASGDHFRSTAQLSSVEGVSAAYPTWLDSVLFTAGTDRRMAVYDLDAMRQVDQISLPGVPVTGAVTVDSRTLYLPIRDPAKLLVVDGQTRRVVATLDLPASPLAAIVPGGVGVCH